MPHIYLCKHLLCYVKFLADKELANLFSGVDKYTFVQQNWIKGWYNGIKNCENVNFVPIVYKTE